MSPTTIGATAATGQDYRPSGSADPARPPHRAGTVPPMTGAVPRITNARLQASVDDVIMQVDQDTVLAARKALLAEADELYQAMMDATGSWAPTQIPGRMGAPGQGVWVGRCSDDPISAPAQISFNRKIADALAPCWKYIHDLDLAGRQLEEVAKRYGYTEQQIQDHFRSASR